MKNFMNTIPVTNILDPDLDQCSVGSICPDLGPNSLKRLSADNKSCSLQEKSKGWKQIPIKLTQKIHKSVHK